MVTFFRSDAADKAMSQLNGVKVDQRPIKVGLSLLSEKKFALSPLQIEVVLDAQHAPAPAPAKALSERVT